MGKHGNHKKCSEHQNHKENTKNTVQRNKQKKIERIEKYFKKPNFCTFCAITLSYTQKYNKFCSKSCAVSYNNKFKKGKKYKLSEKGKENICLSNQKKINSEPYISALKNKINNYNLNPNTCAICFSNLPFELKNRKTCGSKKCLRQVFSNTAKNNNLGGNHNRKSFWYHSPIAGKVFLESSYEKIIAEILDENNIHWLRPKPLKWFNKNNNTNHLYYPDFYLTEYDLYLDPKNDYLITQDQFKITCVIQQCKINLVVLNKNQLTINYIKELICSQ